MVNPKSLANLRPYRKGDGRRRGVAPGGFALTSRLRRRLQQHPEEAEAIVQALVAMGMAKDIAAIKETFDRVDGKVKGETELSGGITINLVSNIPRPEPVK